MFKSQSGIFALLVFSTGFAIVSTVFLALHLFASESSINSAGLSGLPSLTNSLSSSVSPLSQAVSFFEDRSLIFAPTSWVVVSGLWFWRGRTREAWTALGFDSEVFELFMRMKGGKTRTRVMNSLSMPKDRLQLAQELGLDWKAVDHHILLLCRYGFVHEQLAYGRVKMYELTEMGKVLLKLLKESQLKEANPEIAATSDSATLTSASPD